MTNSSLHKRALLLSYLTVGYNILEGFISMLAGSIALVSLILMPLFFFLKHRTGGDLGSASLRVDAKQTLACAFLSLALLMGLGLNYLYGLWQADPLIGLLIVAVLVRKGYETLKEERLCSCCGVSCESASGEQMFVVGVDGCRGGWLAVKLSHRGTWESRIFPDMASLWSYYRRASLILVDIPIGLPEVTNDRPCDKEARKVLGPRKASVFPVPCRAAVYARDYDAALNINEEVTGKRIFRATWNLIPRMRQVDEVLQADPPARRVIREAHPEVLFWGLNQMRPMKLYKKDKAGEAERLEVLQVVYPEATALFFEALASLPKKNAARDDVVDALAATVTGLISAGELKTLPETPGQDAHGLPMEMVYFIPGH